MVGDVEDLGEHPMHDFVFGEVVVAAHSLWLMKDYLYESNKEANSQIMKGQLIKIIHFLPIDFDLDLYILQLFI